jgi:hypothetical protein
MDEAIKLAEKEYKYVIANHAVAKVKIKAAKRLAEAEAADAVAEEEATTGQEDRKRNLQRLAWVVEKRRKAARQAAAEAETAEAELAEAAKPQWAAEKAAKVGTVRAEAAAELGAETRREPKAKKVNKSRVAVRKEKNQKPPLSLLKESSQRLLRSSDRRPRRRTRQRRRMQRSPDRLVQP